MATALIIVDVQVDFCEDGALPVHGGNAVAEAIARHLRDTTYDVVVATRDWHVDPGPHFSTTPDLVNSWPPHCRADTPGAQLHPALAEHGLETCDKGRFSAAYSGFEAPGLQPRLTQAGIDSLVVCGLATDYCVRMTALDGVRFGYPVTVLTALTAGVATDTTDRALAEMRAAGVSPEGPST